MTVLEDYWSAFVGLSQENRQRLPVVEWLLSRRDRGSGRTTLMAMAFVRSCVESRTWVDTFDHIPGDNTHKVLRDTVSALFPNSGVSFTGRHLSVGRTPAFPVRSQVEFNDDFLKVLAADFRAVTRTLLQAGVPVESLVSVVRECLVRDVMST